MRVRFAPSPTGSLHVGGARTALYNYLLAKRHAGTFILRIEDTDQQRHVATATEELMRDLLWLGLVWQEGPQVDGSSLGAYGPYFQSERHGIYQEYADNLIRAGHAYYCFMQEEELLDIKEEKIHTHSLQQVVSPYRDMPLAEAIEKLKTHKATVRVRVPEHKVYILQDALRGNIELPTSMISDFVILRSCGTPVYNFCCVVDDHLMRITDVLRGEEHLSNTLKQMILYDILGFQLPHFAHLSVLVGEDKKKLSKRFSAVSVEAFRHQGFLPEALLNFLVLLGWSHPDGRDICSLDTMVEHFDLSRVHVSSAFFDVKRLRWMNAQYLRQKTAQEIYVLLGPFMTQGMELVAMPFFEAFWKLYASDCETLVDVVDRYMALYHRMRPIELPEALVKDSFRSICMAWRACIVESNTQVVDVDTVRSWIKKCQEVTGFKGRDLFMPLRFIVIGQCEGADVAHMSALLPTEKLLEDVDFFIHLLGC